MQELNFQTWFDICQDLVQASGYSSVDPVSAVLDYNAGIAPEQSAKTYIEQEA
jgi:hypothetical protein